MFEKPTYEELEQRVLELEQAESESKRAEAALRKSDEHLSATLRSIGDGVISCNTDGTVASLNAVAEKFTGWTAVEAEGRPINEIFKIVNAHTRKKAENPVKRSLKEDTVVGLANHTLLIGKHGKEYQIADSCVPVKGKDGKIMGCVLVFSDVTGEYEQREALLKSEDRFRILSNDSPALICEFLPDTTLTFVNHAYCKFFGMSAEKLIGYSFLDLIPEKAREDTKKQFSSLTKIKYLSPFVHAK